MVPHLINEDNLSMAWIRAVEFILNQRNLDCSNLIVHIENPRLTIPEIDLLYENFCRENDLSGYKKVATFIFPQRLYELSKHNRDTLFSKQKKIHQIVRGKWGSYFDQMVDWRETGGNSRNQLNDIINMINGRDRIYKAAYTIQITNPIMHLGYAMGGPCLRYIVLQLEPENRTMSLLAVYRNHDFARRAYGNYLGLGNLLNFLASETNFNLGNITYISSHAYIESKYKVIIINDFREVMQ